MPNLYDREGNLVNVASPAEAQAMVQSGQFALPPGTIQLQDAQGKVFDVDSKDASAAFQTGFSLAGSEAVRHAEVQEKFGGFGGAAAAFGAHGLEALGLNSGLATRGMAALTGSTPEEVSALNANLAEANPIAAGAGTATGLALPAAFTGGAGLAEDAGILTKGLYGAGRALTAPGRALGALGEAVGGGVGAIAGKGTGFLGKLAARGVTYGAQGGAELGVYGGLSAIGETALGDDHELTAEKFWAGVGSGALVGIAGGIGLGAASAAGSTVLAGAKDLLGSVRGRAGDVEKLAARQFGESAEGLGSAYSKASAALSGKDAESIRNLTELTPEGREARRLAVFEGDSTRAEASRALRANINQIQESTKNLSPEWREAKASNVAKTIAQGDEAAAAQSSLAQDAMASVRTKLDEMAADPVMFDARQVKKLAPKLDVAERRLGAAIESGKQENVFVALDTLKRDMGPLGRDLKGPAVSSIERETNQEMKKLYEGLRGALTDPAWGKAGEMQRDVNAAYEKWLSTNSLFNERFMTKTGKEGWSDTFGADPAKIEAYVQGLTSPKNDLTHSIIEQHIASTKELATSLSKAGELTPGKAAELAAVTSSAKAFEGTIAKAEKSLVLTNQLRELERADHGAGAGVLGAAGAMLGGPVGALAGAAVGALANPGRVVRQLAAIERIAGKVDAKLGAGVRAFVRGEAVAPTALKTAVAPAGSVAERFAKESRAIREVAGNPALATERISKAFEGVQAVAPSVAAQLAFKATRATQMLSQMLPAPTMPGGILQQFDNIRYTEADMQRWLRVKSLIDDPVGSTLDALAKNRLSVSDVQIVQQFSPKLFQQMQTMAMTEITNAKSPPTYQRKIMLGVLFGVPADATLSHDFIQMVQTGYQIQVSPPARGAAPHHGGGQKGPTATLVTSGSTASDAVEEGG